jgi:hypothetical protein
MDLTGGLTTSQNVGIGTTNPQATLDVNGTLGFSYSTLPTFTPKHIGYQYIYPVPSPTSGTTFTGVNNYTYAPPMGVWHVFASVQFGTNQSSSAFIELIVSGTRRCISMIPVFNNTFLQYPSPLCYTCQFNGSTNCTFSVNVSVATGFDNFGFIFTRIA